MKTTDKIKVKFCGLRNQQDIEYAADLGVVAVGFVLVEKSPRFVANETAVKLIKSAKAKGLITVVLFADHDAKFVKQIIAECAPDVLQFHGFESPAFCEQFQHRYWKAVPMLNVEDYVSYISQYNNAEAFLLDTYGTGHSGGSGKAFEWFLFPQKHRNKLILAGGLRQNNIADAILQTDANFIDVSSGIEAIKGVKSADKMNDFMRQVDDINHSFTHKQK